MTGGLILMASSASANHVVVVSTVPSWEKFEAFTSDPEQRAQMTKGVTAPPTFQRLASV